MAKSGVSYDLTDVEESSGGFENLPRGNYSASLNETEYAESAAGNPMINCTYVIEGGEFEGRKLWDRIVLTEKALPMLKSKLRVLMEANGLEGEMKKIFKSMSEETLTDLADEGDLIGARVMLTVGFQTYEGEKRNTIKRISEDEDMEYGDDDFMDEDEEEEKPKKKKSSKKKK